MATEKGFKIKYNNEQMILFKNDIELECSNKIQSGQSFLIGFRAFAIDAKHVTPNPTASLALFVNPHDLLGHPGKNTTNKTAEALGLRIGIENKQCFDFAQGKSRRLNLKKTNTNPVITKGDPFYIDTSWIKAKSGGNSEYWILIVDEYTKMCWSFFVAKKLPPR